MYCADRTWSIDHDQSCAQALVSARTPAPAVHRVSRWLASHGFGDNATACGPGKRQDVFCHETAGVSHLRSAVRNTQNDDPRWMGCCRACMPEFQKGFQVIAGPMLISNFKLCWSPVLISPATGSSSRWVHRNHLDVAGWAPELDCVRQRAREHGDALRSGRYRMSQGRSRHVHDQSDPVARHCRTKFL